MVTHLLESGARRRRSFGAAVPSMALHGALILAAIHATAHAALLPADSPRVVPIPLHTPEAPARRARAEPIRHPRASPPDEFEIPSTPRPVAPLLPPLSFTIEPGVSLAPPMVAAREFTDGMKGVRPASDSTATDGVFSSQQVDRLAEPLPGTRAPSYPAALRARGTQGTVITQFVVDSAGHVEAGSVRVLNSANSLFAAAVESALYRARFRPAEVNGVPVRQSAQQSFSFILR